jgi:HEPN domain-containing protein
MEALLGRDELTAVVAFHAQQCVEKVLKTIIEEYERVFKQIQISA